MNYINDKSQLCKIISSLSGLTKICVVHNGCSYIKIRDIAQLTDVPERTINAHITANPSVYASLQININSNNNVLVSGCIYGMQTALCIAGIEHLFKSFKLPYSRLLCDIKLAMQIRCYDSYCCNSLQLLKSDVFNFNQLEKELSKNICSKFKSLTNINIGTSMIYLNTNIEPANIIINNNNNELLNIINTVHYKIESKSNINGSARLWRKCGNGQEDSTSLDVKFKIPNTSYEINYKYTSYDINIDENKIEWTLKQ